MEAKDIIEIVLPGFELNDSVSKEAIAEELGKRYKSIELADKERVNAEGNAYGNSQTKFKQVLADLDVTAEEYKEFKKVEDFANLTTAKIKELKENLKALKESSKGDGKDADKLAELTKQIDGFKSLLEKTNAEKEDIAKQFETSKTEWETKYATEKLNDKVNYLFQKANWTDDSDDIVKEGVKAVYLDGKYQYKEENGKVLVYNKDGSIVPDGTSQMTIERLYEKTLKEAKRFKENAGNSQPPGSLGSPDSGDGKQKSKAQLEYENSIVAEYKNLK